MKIRFATLLMAAVAILALALGGVAATNYKQDNTSQESMTATKPAKQKAKRKVRVKKNVDRGGIPTGSENCLNALAKMAARDPLPDYEGRPSDIVNNGLLWTDAKAKCPIGDDQAKRLKLFELGKAWRMKDAATVRQILTDLGASAGGK